MNIFLEKQENADGTTLGSLGEIKIIERIRASLRDISPLPPRGPGDDCAVNPAVPEKFSAQNPHKLHRLTTTDSLIFGRHFDASLPPADAGRKLVRRNVSDIASMGGVPADALLALVMSGNVSTAWFDAFLLGIASACAESGVELSGGDVASTPCENFFSATLALTGFSENAPLLRTGTRIGDLLFATGTLGGSILKKHFDFRPRVEEGRFLASLPAGAVRACIDITDGLLKDHSALLPENAHAEFDFSALPVSPDVALLPAAVREGKIPPQYAAGTPLSHVFCDGEDYELLFAVAPEFAGTLRDLWRERFPGVPLSCIAEIAAGADNPALRERLAPDARAYEHFCG